MTQLASAGRFAAYLPRLLVVALDAGRRRMTEDPVSLVFGDISGFTALSERLADEGRIGAERVTRIVNGAFEELLGVGRLEGGDVTAFGGDAILMAFTGPDHARRAATTAWQMQVSLDEYQAEESPVPLSMSVGVATGPVTAFAAGTDQRLVVLGGATVDEVVALEGAARPGEVLVSESVADQLDPWCRGDARDGGVVLADEPDPSDHEPTPAEPPDDVSGIVAFVPPALREELGIVRLEGEHRPAVVGFVKFGGLTDAVDDGTAADALDALVDATSRAARAHGVSVLSVDLDHDGGKLLLAAGVPAAVTDPADRMLRTMRAVVEADLDLAVRAGVAQGDVFAGDVGATFRRTYTVMGDTVNLAARLTAAATPGTVLTTREVLDAAPGRFAARDLDPITPKGKSAPVTPIEVGPAVGTGGDDAERVPYVGRREERDTVLAALEQATTGRGAGLDITGPPGSGKSRLIVEARESAVIGRSIVVECEEYESGTPWHTARILIRSAIGIDLRASPEAAGDALSTWAATRAPDLAPWLPLVAVAADAQVPSTPEVDALDPAFRTDQAARAVAELLESAVEGPALFGIDDAQWIDSASEELLETVMARSAHQPWVWMWARNPDDVPIPTTLPLPLQPLPDDEVAALATTAQPDLAPERVTDVVERAGGSPLFTIALARTLDDQLPDSVERLIAARIDALGRRERQVLRYASVLGGQFDLDLLSESLAEVASGLDDPTVWEGLASDLEVTALGRVRFRQALVRDVAYGTLSFERRTQLHGSVADTIVRRARHRAAREAAVISFHYERAGRWQETWEFATVAAERATRRWATAEAATAWQRAIAATEHVEVAHDALAEAHEALGDTLDTLGRHDDAAAAFARALDLDPGRASAITRKLALLDEKAGDYDRGEARLEEALAAARTLEDRVEAMVALAGLRNRQGDFAGSAAWVERALAADPEAEAERSAAHARYLQVHNLLNTGGTGWEAHGEAAVAIYERLNDQLGLAKVLNNLGIGAYYRGRWDEAADLYERGRAAAGAAGDPVTTAMLDNNIGEIRSDQGRLDEARALFETAEDRWTRAGFAIGQGLVASNLGRLAARSGDPDGAVAQLESAATALEEIGAAHLAAEARARIAEAHLLSGATDTAATVARTQLADVPAEPWSVPVRALLLRVVGQAEGDHGALRTALDLVSDGEHEYERGLVLAALGRTDEGTTVLDRLGATAALGFTSTTRSG